MELLTRTYRTVRRLLTPNGWFTFGICLFLIVTEVVGRFTYNDLHDAFIAGVLGAIIAVVFYRHQKRPLPWVSLLARAGSRVYQAAKGLTFELGIDMRGSPRIKRGYPPGVLFLAAVLVVWFASLAIAGDELPQAFRAAGVRVFYLAYLAALLLRSEEHTSELQSLRHL